MYSKLNAFMSKTIVDRIGAQLQLESADGKTKRGLGIKIIIPIAATRC
jgi:hypothetical protein